MELRYKKPIIFELGNVSELTAGGRSSEKEIFDDICYDANRKVITHYYTQPEE